MALFGFATEGCRAGSNINKTQPRVSSAGLNSAGGAEEGLEKERWQEREEGESSHSYLHFGNYVMAERGQADREGPCSRTWDSMEWRYLCQKCGNGNA